MKHLDFYKFLFIPAVLSVTLFSLCSPKVAGGGSGTDVSASVVRGTVIDTLNQPVAGCLVRLRPFDYIPSSDYDFSSSAIKRDAVTGADGSFTLDSIPAGCYMIECITSDSQAFATSYIIDSTDTFTIPEAAVMHPMATVSGKDPSFIPDASNDRYVEVRGFERSVRVNGKGHFTLNVPAGTHRFHFPARDSQHQAIDTSLVLVPGEQKELFSTCEESCEDLECEMTCLRQLLAANSLSVPPDSVITVENNHIVALHLRNLSIDTLTDSIFLLSKLRVLDISFNSIRTIPADIGQLQNLEEFYANNNYIKTVPEHFGTLSSLRIVFLFRNQLNFIPDSFMNLQVNDLRIGDNRLCDLSIEMAEWLDEIDSHWRKQECNDNQPLIYPSPEHNAATELLNAGTPERALAR